MILGKRNDFDICGCCGRAASGVGYAARDKSPVLWVCEACVPVARKVSSMPEKSLSVYEKHAVVDATKAVMARQIEVVLSALWDAGIQSLADLTPEKLDTIMEKMTIDGEMNETTRDALLAFGASIRSQAGKGEAPF